MVSGYSFVQKVGWALVKYKLLWFWVGSLVCEQLVWMFAEDRHSQRTGKRGHPIHTARVANHSGAPVHYSAVKVSAESESDALRTWCETGETFQISMDFPWQHGNLNMATDDINHKPWDIMGCHGILDAEDMAMGPTGPTGPTRSMNSSSMLLGRKWGDNYGDWKWIVNCTLKSKMSRFCDGD